MEKPGGRRHDAFTDYHQRIQMGDEVHGFEAEAVIACSHLRSFHMNLLSVQAIAACADAHAPRAASQANLSFLKRGKVACEARQASVATTTISAILLCHLVLACTLCKISVEQSIAMHW